MAIYDPDIVAAEHFTALEDVAAAWGTFTDEGEDFCNEQLLEMGCGRGGVEFGEAWEAFVVEDEDGLDHRGRGRVVRGRDVVRLK